MGPGENTANVCSHCLDHDMTIARRDTWRRILTDQFFKRLDCDVDN